MQNLKHLNDEMLLAETDRLVHEEREHLTVILHHLREIERRRLFSVLKFSSLFAYAVGHLKYSEDQACRRIAAMRLMSKMPEIEEKIASGELTLTHIGMAQMLFSSEKKQGREMTPGKKAEVFEAIAGRSTREAQKAAAKFAPKPPPTPDSTKPLGEGRNLAKVELRDETLKKLKKLKGLLAHESPNMTHNELVNKLCDLALEQWDPAKPAKHQRKADSKLSDAEISREVWRRDGSACTNCHSTYAVEEDHIVPRSMGGAYSVENLRLLCRSCNQRAAIEKLGQDKMDPYLSPAAQRMNPVRERGNVYKPEGAVTAQVGGPRSLVISQSRRTPCADDPHSKPAHKSHSRDKARSLPTADVPNFSTEERARGPGIFLESVGQMWISREMD